MSMQTRAGLRWCVVCGLGTEKPVHMQVAVLLSACEFSKTMLEVEAVRGTKIGLATRGIAGPRTWLGR